MSERGGRVRVLQPVPERRGVRAGRRVRVPAGLDRRLLQRRRQRVQGRIV